MSRDTKMISDVDVWGGSWTQQGVEEKKVLDAVIEERKKVLGRETILGSIMRSPLCEYWAFLVACRPDRGISEKTRHQHYRLKGSDRFDRAGTDEMFLEHD